MIEQSTGLQKLLHIVAVYDNDFKKWEARTQKIIKRYRDDNRSQNTNETAKFNILWSNVQTLIPAVYARLPKADVSRRFGDNDQVGRVASLLIERALDFEIEHYTDFRSAMKHCVEDRFLGGRGVSWVRYEPHVKAIDMPEDGLEITEDVESPDEQMNGAEPLEEIEDECAPTDYVHWKDFGHAVARTWEEVTAVWRWVYMTREALIERFGKEVGNKIPFDAGPDTLKQYGQSTKEHTRAKICEYWDKETGKVYWFSKSMPNIIDERDDPLQVEGFFPCPKPLFATMTSDTLVPVPDFVLYQDQANELDILSDRIDGLVKALRVRGVYDASQPALQRLMTEGENNALLPVDSWMAFGEKGGLKGAIDFLPIDMIAATLIQCYQARTEIKNQIYEITGLSDIIRGSSFASETATAQQIKGQYASIRLRSMQEDVALFASGLLRLKAQIICTKFQPATILKYAAADQMQPEDQQLIPQALMLLKDKPLRNFRIEVAADSLVQLDEQQMKAERNEFIGALGNFLKQALPLGQAAPEMIPMIGEVLKFGIAAFKGARQIEGAIDQSINKLVNKPAAQPQPNPEMMKMQAEQQLQQAKMQAEGQLEQAKMQANMQVEQAKLQLEQAKAQREVEIEQMRAQIDAQKLDFERQKAEMEEQYNRWKTELDAATKVTVARIGANPGVDIPLVEAATASAERMTAELGTGVQMALQNVEKLQQDMALLHDQTAGKIDNLLNVMAAPKRIIRGPDGKAVGVEIAT
jgi:molecular chaperone GrpE (heat shock protein)